MNLINTAMRRQLTVALLALTLFWAVDRPASAQTQPQIIRDSQMFHGRNINDWALALVGGTITARACSSDAFAILKNNLVSILQGARRRGTLTRQGRGILEHLDRMIEHGVREHKRHNKSCNDIERFNRWIMQNSLTIVDSYK